MAETPTQRTLKELRSRGYLAGVVEYWQPSHAAREVVSAAEASGGKSTVRLVNAVSNLAKFGPGKRQDLFHFVDVVAVGVGVPLLVQCTAYSGVSARVTKIVTEYSGEALACLRDGFDVQVWGWKKHAKPVQRKLWRPTIKHLRLASNGGISVEVDKPVSVVDSPKATEQSTLPF